MTRSWIKVVTGQDQTNLDIVQAQALIYVAFKTKMVTYLLLSNNTVKDQASQD